jgi:hypothetical protein
MNDFDGLKDDLARQGNGLIIDPALIALNALFSTRYKNKKKSFATPLFTIMPCGAAANFKCF